MSDNTKRLNASGEQSQSPRMVAEILSRMPEEKRMIATMSVLSFVGGMEAMCAMMEKENKDTA